MKGKAAVTAALLAIGGGVVVTTTTRTTPGITFSNVLTKPKDGRVIVSTLVPKPTWRGGQTWVITIAHPTRVESLMVRAETMRNTRYADSIFAPFPTCVPYRVTVLPDTALTTKGARLTRRDSLTAKLSLCRPYTRAEAADLDSFPRSKNRLQVCDGGTAKPGPIAIAVGDSIRMVVVDTNRYTGKPAFRDGTSCP